MAAAGLVGGLWLDALRMTIGVFALTLVVGSRLGLGAGAVLLHYIGVQIALALIVIVLKVCSASRRSHISGA